jgi:hypothetical protein
MPLHCESLAPRGELQSDRAPADCAIDPRQATRFRYTELKIARATAQESRFPIAAQCLRKPMTT